MARSTASLRESGQLGAVYVTASKCTVTHVTARGCGECERSASVSGCCANAVIARLLGPCANRFASMELAAAGGRRGDSVGTVTGCWSRGWQRWRAHKRWRSWTTAGPLQFRDLSRVMRSRGTTCKATCAVSRTHAPYRAPLAATATCRSSAYALRHDTP